MPTRNTNKEAGERPLRKVQAVVQKLHGSALQIRIVDVTADFSFLVMDRAYSFSSLLLSFFLQAFCRAALMFIRWCDPG